jgi:hypothetical protein
MVETLSQNRFQESILRISFGRKFGPEKSAEIDPAVSLNRFRVSSFFSLIKFDSQLILIEFNLDETV